MNISQANSSKYLNNRLTFLAVLKCLCFIFGCNFLYRLMPTSHDSIFSAFMINMLGAFCVLIVCAGRLAPFRFFPSHPKWLMVPTLILVVALSAGMMSSLGRGYSLHFSQYLLSVVLVPIAEEILFRVGLWGWLGPVSNGARIYLTSVSFAALHSASNSWPIGPFLLGVLSQVILLRGGGLLTAILLHMACNATVVIFLALDPRWLDWLSVFYLHYD